MLDKEELIERIENTLTTRTVKELFKSIVEQCRDVPIPDKCEADDNDGWHEIDYKEGWNACIEEIEK